MLISLEIEGPGVSNLFGEAPKLKRLHIGSLGSRLSEHPSCPWVGLPVSPKILLLTQPTQEASRMVKRRLERCGIPLVFSNHSFRATGITEFLANGGSLESAQQLANHADSRTTKLYDRRATRFELEEIVRIRF